MSAKVPSTAATRLLRAAKVPYTEHPYEYVDHGGTAVSAAARGVDEHVVIKTLVMEDDMRKPMIVLMHGDCEVSTKNLARLASVKAIAPCKPEVANKHSGYVVGGTSPFGTRKAMTVYMQQSIADLPRIYINGGGRGFLVSLATSDAIRLLQPVLVDVAIRRD